MRGLLGVFLFFPVCAWAQSLPENNAVTSPPLLDNLSATSYCTYPNSALRAGTEGRTFLSFSVAADGQVTDVSVIRSSGDESLDRQSVSCLSSWSFNPKLPWFHLVIGAHRAMIRWTIPSAMPGVPPTPPFGQFLPIPHSCEGWYPEAALKAKIEGTTKLHFRIDTDGGVNDPVVDTSSGNADLDQAAVECVKLWHYLPARQDGKAVTSIWTANIVWKMDD